MLKLIRLGVKAGIASSAIYLTIDNGVWKDSETTAILFEMISNEVSTQISPLVSKIPVELPDLPKTGSLASNLQVTWNKGVNTTFRFVAASPTCAAGYAKQGYSAVVEKINEISNESNK